MEKTGNNSRRIGETYFVNDITLFEFVKGMTFEQFSVWITDITTEGNVTSEEILRWKSYLNGKVNTNN